MCGLVGVAGDLRFQDEFTMRRLLLADYFRGPDSTGMAAIRTAGDAVISKIASNPIDLFGMASFKSALNGNASRAFIGHNRLATRGGISTVNAHPFQVDHIVGAHNGTLDKASVKALQDKLGEEFAVDSMALFASIAKFGIEKTIKMCYEGTTTTEGAWALVWFDKKEGTLNFLRNKHRPLYYAYEGPAKEGDIGFKRMFWASEWWMMREAVASSNPGYKIYTQPGTTTGFFPFDEDVHYKYDLAALCVGGVKIPKPKCKKIKGKEVVVSSIVPFDPNPKGLWPRNTGTNGTHGGTASNPKSPKTHSTTKSHGKSDKKNVISLSGTIRHPYANIIPEEKFVNYGEKCFWCKKGVKFGEPGVTFFEKDSTLLCRKCSGYDDKHPCPPVRVYVHGSVIDSLM